ncbi:hypothetical protein [Paracoccus cavernae]|uniref:hypothetical protein n=1 Tax=Paracoccus cavernae TaxID=1571207 RepID=UPI0035F4348B
MAIQLRALHGDAEAKALSAASSQFENRSRVLLHDFVTGRLERQKLAIGTQLNVVALDFGYLRDGGLSLSWSAEWRRRADRTLTGSVASDHVAQARCTQAPLRCRPDATSGRAAICNL